MYRSESENMSGMVPLRGRQAPLPCASTKSLTARQMNQKLSDLAVRLPHFSSARMSATSEGTLVDGGCQNREVSLKYLTDGNGSDCKVAFSPLLRSA